MAKRTKRQEERGTSEQAAVNVPEPVDEMQALYTVGLWKGYKQFRCVKCKFDTLNEEAMYRHLNTHRPAQPAAVKPSVLVADKHGNEVDDFTLTSQPLSPRGEGSNDDVFEVELKEIDSTVDENGDVHKTFTVKE